LAADGQERQGMSFDTPEGFFTAGQVVKPIDYVQIFRAENGWAVETARNERHEKRYVASTDAELLEVIREILLEGKE
jgi:hypothetical protein